MSAAQTPSPTQPPPREHTGGWAPMRSPAFRRLWSAQFVSNVGSWMQTVAAQWVMVSLTSSALLVSAIGAAGSLPVLLLAIPAGALGDLVDRRRLIVITQIVMLVAAAGLALLAAVSGLTPAVILALLFVVGCGGAASAPAWQTLQPELVPPEDRQQAIALGSVNQNLARAVGPALGGILLAATSAALVFGVNAVSFVAVVIAVAATALPKRASALPREHAIDAVRAGGRYVAFSPVLRALIVRALAFIFPASAIWALLPLVARGKLGLGSTGYGLLLGCVGIGAFAAASLAPAARRLGPRMLYAAAAASIAGATVVLALSHEAYLDAIALVLAGAAWISGLPARRRLPVGDAQLGQGAWDVLLPDRFPGLKRRGRARVRSGRPGYEPHHRPARRHRLPRCRRDCDLAPRPAGGAARRRPARRAVAAPAARRRPGAIGPGDGHGLLGGAR